MAWLQKSVFWSQSRSASARILGNEEKQEHKQASWTLEAVELQVEGDAAAAEASKRILPS